MHLRGRWIQLRREHCACPDCSPLCTAHQSTVRITQHQPTQQEDIADTAAPDDHQPDITLASSDSDSAAIDVTQPHHGLTAAARGEHRLGRIRKRPPPMSDAERARLLWARPTEEVLNAVLDGLRRLASNPTQSSPNPSNPEEQP